MCLELSLQLIPIVIARLKMLGDFHKILFSSLIFIYYLIPFWRFRVAFLKIDDTVVSREKKSQIVFTIRESALETSEIGKSKSKFVKIFFV